MVGENHKGGGFVRRFRGGSIPTLEQEDNQQPPYVLPGNARQCAFVALLCIVALMWQQSRSLPGGIHLRFVVATVVTTLSHNALRKQAVTQGWKAGNMLEIN